jgi:hypothetical protein
VKAAGTILPIGSIKRPTWLFTKKKAREMGKKRWSSLPPAELDA